MRKKSKFVQEQRFNDSRNKKFTNSGERRVRQFNRLVDNYQDETKQLVQDSLDALKEANLIDNDVNLDNVNFQSKLFKINFLLSNVNKKIELFKNTNDASKVLTLENTREDIHSLLTFDVIKDFKTSHTLEDLPSIIENVNNCETMTNETTKIDFSNFDKNIKVFTTDENRDIFKLIFFSFVESNINKNYFFISQFMSVIDNVDPNDEYIKILSNNIINLVNNYIGKEDTDEVHIS